MLGQIFDAAWKLLLLLGIAPMGIVLNWYFRVKKRKRDALVAEAIRRKNEAPDKLEM